MSEKSFDEIQVPDTAEKIVNSAIKRGERTLLMKRTIITVIAVCIFITGVFGTCYASPTVADTLSKIPLIGSLFVQFADDGLKLASEKRMTNFPGLEVTNGDETVAIKEIYFDKSRISIGFALKGINPYASDPITELYYNDKLISGSFGGGITEASKDLYYMDLTTDIPNNIPDEFDLKVIVKEQSGFKRDFEFTVPIDRTLANTKTTEIFLMKKIESKERAVLIKKVQFTPSAVSIDFEYTRPLNESDFTLKLIDDGKEIQLNTMSGTSTFNESSRIDTYHAIFNPLDNIPSQLKLDFVNKNDEKVILSTQFDIKEYNAY